MSRRIAILFAILAAAAMHSAGAADAVAIGVDAENPPFMYAAEGRAAGLYPAIIAAAFAQMGQAANIEAKPWKRCLRETDDGKAGIGGIYKNEERLKKYDFSEPIFVEKMAVYFNRANPLVFHAVTDLAGKRVGVIRGWSYGDTFDQAVRDGRITVDEVASDAMNFKKLLAGRVDAVLAIDEAGVYQLESGQFDGVEKSGPYLFQKATYLAFSKQAKQAGLLARFNKVIDDMRKSGKLGRIASAELARQ